jgi:polyhydroxyalkanoate synthesis regulator phasin
MSSGEGKSERSGLPESLRTAVERTLQATSDTASETAERAQELLDEVARRGQEAREGVARVGRIRFGSAEEISELNERLASIERRLAELERLLQAQSKSQLEG